MIPDLLRPGLKLVFCGYNPSILSGKTGHNYAHPGNRFWRAIAAAGITERVYLPGESAALLELGIGFTNLVARPTRRADELSRTEILAGSEVLIRKLQQHRPGAVAYTGIGVYKWLRRSSSIGWGVQPAPAVEGVVDIVVPSPSGLNRMTFDQIVDQYRVLVPFVR
ncbi:MAG TPA: mismatch-specific DNA-glycosylase [Thermomicrobiales bacterium]|nr:mismatch-specific DNA-glycosylase [Thermomicrobiales bacterium]